MTKELLVPRLSYIPAIALAATALIASSAYAKTPTTLAQIDDCLSENGSVNFEILTYHPGQPFAKMDARFSYWKDAQATEKVSNVVHLRFFLLLAEARTAAKRAMAVSSVFHTATGRSGHVVFTWSEKPPSPLRTYVVACLGP
jgi:predicted secreted Zn-dependent protease